MPGPSIVDLAVRDVVERVLADYELGVAEIRQKWDEQAGMWFTEVQPSRRGAAPLSMYEGILRAVVAGRVEESGSASRSFARMHTAEGTVGVGHGHAPLPWRWRTVRRYESYGDRR